jgi:hypothetical protein
MTRSLMSFPRLVIFAALLCIFLLGVGVSSAYAELTIEGLTANVTSSDAGAHPDASSSLSFKSSLRAVGPGESQEPAIYLLPDGGIARDLVVKLPPGFLGDPQATPQCSAELFYKRIENDNPFTREVAVSACPADSQIGVTDVYVTEQAGGKTEPIHLRGDLYNLSGGPYAPARIGIAVRTPLGMVMQEATAGVGDAAEDYAITLTIHEISRLTQAVLIGGSLTLWGVPAAHERSGGSVTERPPFPVPVAPEPVSRWRPFVENPTDCLETPVAFFSVNTYAEPDMYASLPFTLPDASNCQLVPFAPSISVGPRPRVYPGVDSTRVGAPTGVGVELSLPQNERPAGRGTSALKEAVLVFPVGMAISPSAAAGDLQSCTDEEFALESSAPSRCPAASLIGEDEIETPLLPGPLKGKVYLGQPLRNEPESGEMFRIFQEFQGFTVDVKLVGNTRANERTGQLEVRAGLAADGEPNIPELPFTHFRVHTRGGPNAVLVNQPGCGPSMTMATLTPYSSPGSPVQPSSTFTTSYDGQGASCPASLPFLTSSWISGASGQAGAFTPLTVSFSRMDGTQPLGRITAHLPPGLLGYVSSVTLCEPAEAAAGTCPAASRVGVVSATAGAGPDPLTVPGSVYLARGSNGYPFALSVVVPAVAGPYDLGNVVVLVNLEVHNDGSLTAISNELPSIFKGVPLDIRGVTVTIDRPNFTFNPTNCSPLSMGAQIVSLGGVVASISVPFQVSGCGSLPFRPSFTVATQGSTSRAYGASLVARVSQRPGEAAIHSVKVELPKQLPARLTTLQKACPDRVFDVNPAACGAGSLVGSAVAYTPVLREALRGPAYFVSHGGVKFPELILVLQGDGVTIELGGETFINSKTGVTSSTFPAVPDVPIDSFELKLPEGRYSALAANGKLCGSKLVMPTTIEGQNSIVVKQSTKIAVSGCPKTKKTKKAKKAEPAKHREKAQKSSQHKARKATGRS